LKSRYGTISLIVADPNNAPSYGNTVSADSLGLADESRDFRGKVSPASNATTSSARPQIYPPKPAGSNYGSSSKTSGPSSSSSGPGRKGGPKRPKPTAALQYSDLSADSEVPKPNLPQQWKYTDAELQEKKKRWAKFAAYLAQPFNYDSKFTYQLQHLDKIGVFFTFFFVFFFYIINFS
jgi:hypothetical protein